MASCRRRRFEHEGKVCYSVAECSTSSPRVLINLLDPLRVLKSAPIEMTERYMRFTGLTDDKCQYFDFKVCPLKGDGVALAAPGEATTSVAGGGKNKKRKADTMAMTDDDDDDSEEEEDGLDVFHCDDEASTLVVPQTNADYYRRYDDRDQTVQVDMDVFLHNCSIGKRADVLRIVIYSFSETGEIDRVLIESEDRNTTTTVTIVPQILTCETFSLEPREATYAITLPSEFFATSIKEIVQASQGEYVKITMSPRGLAQTLTLSSTGDTGTVNRIIRPDVASKVKFHNDDGGPPYSHAFMSKPIIHIGRIAPVSRFVIVYLSDDTPLKLYYNVPCLADAYWFLSPRIDDDPPPILDENEA